VLPTEVSSSSSSLTESFSLSNAYEYEQSSLSFSSHRSIQLDHQLEPSDQPYNEHEPIHKHEGLSNPFHSKQLSLNTFITQGFLSTSNTSILEPIISFPNSNPLPQFVDPNYSFSFCSVSSSNNSRHHDIMTCLTKILAKSTQIQGKWKTNKNKVTKI
jgi:hypothetical protein